MSRVIELTTQLDCTPEEAQHWVQKPALLHHIASPLIRFVPSKSTPFPANWEEGNYRAWMWLFGVIPIGWQAICISLSDADGAHLEVRDNGYSPLIKTWDHRIAIAPSGIGTRYTDRVALDAGWLTGPVMLFASVFFRHRQRRWRALAASDFAALK